MKRTKKRLHLHLEAIRDLRTLDDSQLPQVAGGHLPGPGSSGGVHCIRPSGS
jgi:hypothetical protein